MFNIYKYFLLFALECANHECARRKKTVKNMLKSWLGISFLASPCHIINCRKSELRETYKLFKDKNSFLLSIFFDNTHSCTSYNGTNRKSILYLVLSDSFHSLLYWNSLETALHERLFWRKQWTKKNYSLVHSRLCHFLFF